MNFLKFIGAFIVFAFVLCGITPTFGPILCVVFLPLFASLWARWAY